MTFGSLIVSANLNAQDKLYPSGGHAVVTDMASRTYGNGQRQTDHYLYETTSGNTYEKTEIYYDRLKGVALDYSYVNQETSGGYTTTMTETLTSTNADVWAIPEFPVTLTPLLLLMAVPIALIALKKQRIKKLSALVSI